MSERVVAGDVDDEFPAFPTLYSVAQRFGRQFALDALVPVFVFLGVNGACGLAWAVAASSAWSSSLIVVRRRARTTAGPVVWFSLGYALLRGAGAIIAGSATLYFGPAVVGNLVGGLAFVGSVVVRRPIVGAIATIFYPFPDEVRRGGAYRRVFGHLTLAWAAFLILSGVLQGVLLATTTASMYLVVRSIITWPLMVVLFVISLRYPRHALARELATSDPTDRNSKTEGDEE